MNKVKHLAFGIGILISSITYAQPVISSVSPTTVAAGSTLTVNGSGFAIDISFQGIEYLEIFIDEQLAGSKSDSDDGTITVTVPANSYGTANVYAIYHDTEYDDYYSKSNVTQIEITNASSGFTLASGSFLSESTFLGGNGLYGNGLITADLTGDFKPEIIAVNESDNSISIHRNYGSRGSFGLTENQTTLVTEVQPRSVAVGDFDGDGLQDIAVANVSSNSVIVFENTTMSGGSVSFSTAINVGSITFPEGISVGDIDNDGYDDIVAGQRNTALISVIRSTSTGDGVISFASPLSFSAGSGVNSTTLVDMDNDGFLDVVTTNTTESTISLIDNRSTGPGSVNFLEVTSYSTTGTALVVRAADFDGDGLADVAVSNDEGSVDVFPNASVGAGNFLLTTKQNFMTDHYTVGLEVGDLDDDGKADILTTGTEFSDVNVLQNTSTVGSISFGNGLPFYVGYNYDVDIADINGDGLADILAANPSNEVYVWRNTGLSAELPVVSWATPSETIEVALGSTNPIMGTATLQKTSNGDASITFGYYIGDTISFSKSDYADYTLAANQDSISSGVKFTRKDSQGLFNIASETGYVTTSPDSTLWSSSSSAATSSYTQTWVSAHGNNPPGMIGSVYSFITQDVDARQFDIMFNSWTQGGSGGGFSYDRVETPQYFTSDISSATISASTQAVNYTIDPTGLAEGMHVINIAAQNTTFGVVEMKTITLNVTGGPLVAQYDFSGDATDASGKGNDGTLFGLPGYEVDRFGNIDGALTFDGIDDYVDVSTNAELEINAPFSFSFWVKTTDASSPNLITYGGWEYAFYLSGADFAFSFDGTQSATASFGGTAGVNFVTDGNWHHLVTTYDGDSAKLYVDNILTNTYLGATQFTYPSAEVNIGYYYGNGKYFQGSIDDIKVYNQTIDQTKIDELYAEGNWPTSSANSVSFYGTAIGTETTLPQLAYNADRFVGVFDLTVGAVNFNVDRNGSVVSYGDFDNTALDYVAEEGGTAIDVPVAGRYFVQFSRTDSKYSVYQLTDIGLTGSALTGDGTGWNQDVNFTDAGNGVYSLSGVDLFTGEWKIRANAEWTANWGDNEQDGVFEYDGVNIPVDTGTYDFTIDIVNNTYSVDVHQINYSIADGDLMATSGIFTDSGGENGNYADNENYTATITTGVTGEGVSLTFTSFDVELDYDYLYIYDGPDVSYPLIGTYTGNSTDGGNLPSTVTATNVQGALTLVFLSDGGVTTAGWVADISTVSLPLPEKVAEYRFEGDSVDATGNGNDGTLVNVSETSDRFGDFPGAYYFNGADTYISVPDSWQMQYGNDHDFAISGWFRADAADGILFDKSDGYTGYLGWLQSDSTLFFYVVQDGVASYSLTTSTTWADGAWHHYVMQTDRDAGMNIYVDGNLEVSNVVLTNAINADTQEDFLVGVAGETGNTNLNTYFTGDLDDFTIFSRTLTDQEVFDLYNVNGWNASQVQIADIHFDSATYVDGFGTFDTSTGSPVGTEPGFADDRFAYSSAALSLDGSSQYVKYESTSDSEYDLESYGTASVWVNPSSYGTGSTILQFTNGLEKYLVEFTLDNTGIPTATIHDGVNSGSVSTGGVVPLNTWTHIVMRWNPDYISIFVNGEFNNYTDTFLNAISGDLVELVVGADYVGSDNYFAGLIDDITFYNEELSDNEIKALFHENLWPAQDVTNVDLWVNTAGDVTSFNLGQYNDQGFEYWVGVQELTADQTVSFEVTQGGQSNFYGDGDGDDIADLNGSDITISENGLYYIRYNASNNEYLLYKINTVSLIGSAITGDDTGWNQDLTLYDNGGGNFSLPDVTLFDGEFKLRANADWSVLNWGDDNANPDGFFEIFGQNIPVLAGTYDFLTNVVDNTYTLTPALGKPQVYEIYPLSTSEIQLTWSDVANETGYRIYKKAEVDQVYELVADVGADITSYIESGLPADNFGIYYIESYNDVISKSGYYSHPVATFSTSTETKSQYFNLIGDANDEVASESWVDDSGYYVFGTFDNSITLGGATYNVSGKGLYAVKYDHNHNFVWSVAQDSYNATVGYGDIRVYGATGSAGGFIYLTGYVAGDLNGQSSYQYLDANSNTVAQSNAYVLVINATTGVITNSKIIQSTGYGVGEDLDMDGANNVFLAAQFKGDVTLAGSSYFDPGATLLKMDATLNDTWMVYGSGSGDGMGWGVDYDVVNDVVYLTGRMYGTTDFSTSGEGVLTSNGDADFFLAKYDLNGTFLWAINEGGDGYDLPWDVVLDGSNNPYITGYFFSSSVTVGTSTYTNTGNRDMLLIKYDNLGNVIWSTSATGSIREYALSMASDGSNIYLTGYKDENVSNFSGLEVSNGETFLASYANDGAINWVDVLEGDGLGADVNVYNGKVYQVGQVRNRVNQGGNYYDTNGGSTDAFISIYNPNQLAPGLVGYYTFDGSSTADMSGNGFDGTPVNSPLFSIDRFGNYAGGFEPESNATYIDIQNGDSWSFGGAFAISAWIRPNDFYDEGEEFLTTIVDGPGQFSLASTTEERTALIYHWEESSAVYNIIQSDGLIERNQWTHVAMTVDSNNDLRMYINGEPQNISRDGTNYSASINIGRTFDIVGGLTLNNAGSRYFSGSIDDVRFYTGVEVSGQTILDQYEMGVSGGIDRLVAAYDFTSADLSDVSGNNFSDGGYYDVNGSFVGTLIDTGRDGDASGAVAFDNTGGFVSYFHERAINVNNNSTVNLWVKPYDLPESGRLGDVVFSDGAQGRLMYSPDGSLFYHYPDNIGGYPAFYESSPSVVAGEWQMITYTIDNDDNLAVYHNGNLVIYDNISDQNPNTSVSFTIGLNDNYPEGDLDRYLNGAVDDVSIRQRVMSADEVSTMYITSDNRLLAYYPFVGDAADATGNGNNGQINGATLASDRFGISNRAFVFNGTDQDISGTVANFPTGDASLSFTAWVNTSDMTQTASIVSIGEDVSQGRASMAIEGGILSFVGQNNDVTSSTSIPSGKWTHLAIVKNASNVDFYIDGSFVTTVALGLAQDYQYNLLSIGSTFGNREFFNGSIDDVRIYGVALSTPEIASIYEQEAPGQSQIAYYPWQVDANDYSGNDYHGTLIGAAYIDGLLAIGDNAQDGVLLPVETIDGFSDFTFATYVNFAGMHATGGTSSNALISSANGSTDNALHLFYDKNINSWRAGINGTFTDTQFFDDQVLEDTWYHVAFIRSGGDVTVYVDGSSKGTAFIDDQPLGAVSGGLVIGQEQDNANGGSYQQDQSLNGYMLNTRIFNSALSQTDIQALATNDAPTPPIPASNVNAAITSPTSVLLTWSDNADNETGYTVEISDGVNTFAIDTLSANSTSLYISGLTTDVSYSFTVVAKNAAGSSSDANSFVIATPVQLSTPIVAISPASFTLDDEITITYYPDRSYPVGDLISEAPIYMHSGLVLPGNEYGAWNVAIGNWGADDGVGQMTDNGDGSWSITFIPRSYYGVATDYVASQLAMVFRNANGTLAGRGPELNDFYIDLFRSDAIEKVPGQFATFNGSNAITTNTPNNLSAWVTPNQFTVEHWVNFQSLPAENGWMGMFSRVRDDQREFATGVYRNPAGSGGLAFEFWLQDGSNYVQIPDLDDATLLQVWNHFAVTYDGTTNDIKIYWNGVLTAQATASITYNNTAGTTSEYLLAGETLDGFVDDIRFWNYVLPVEEIRDRVSVGLDGNESGLAGYWPLDELLSDGIGTYTPDLTSNDNRLYGDVVEALPDLAVSLDVVNGTSVGSSPELFTGDNSIQYAISNLSADATLDGTQTTSFYMSTDDVWDGFDTFLGSDEQILSLGTSASTSFTTTVSTPSGLSAGNYYIISIGDINNQIDEIDEGNNGNVINVTLVGLLPLDAPNGLVLSSTSTNSLTFSWNDISDPGVSYGYYWELHTNSGFTGFVDGDLITTTSATVSGLNAETTYFFRVRVESQEDSRTSTYTTSSGTTDTPIADTTPPSVLLTPAQTEVLEGEFTSVFVNISASDENLDYVDVFQKGALASDYTYMGSVESSGSVTINANYEALAGDFDSEGLTIQAIAYDYAGNNSIDVKTIRIDISPTDPVDLPQINVASSDGTAEVTDYQMIAWPYNSFPASSLFDGISSDSYRIETWSNSSQGYAGQSTINPGIGYWLIISDNSVNELTYTGLSKADVEGEAFEIQIAPGWNQIGNPFLDRISWADVLSYNDGKNFSASELASSPYIWNGSGYSNSGTLSEYQGAFIEYNGTSNTILEIPYSALPSSGRVSAETAQPRAYFFEGNNWEIVMSISANDKYTYGVAGFGEHEGSISGADKLDVSTPPMFDQFINVTMGGRTLSGNTMARSIKESTTNNTWMATISSHLREGSLMDIDFNGLPSLEAGESLVLFDMQNGRTIDLTQESSYSITYQTDYQLKFIKGTAEYIESESFVENLLVTNIYPNPSDGLFKFDLLVPKTDGSATVYIQASDLSGRKIVDEHINLGSGNQRVVELDLRNEGLKTGLYIFEIQVVNENSLKIGNKITKKGYLITK